MSRYIDIDKVLKELHLNHKDVIYIDKNDTAKRIEKIPSIDLVDYVPKDFHDKTCEAMAKRHTEEIQMLMPKRGEWIRDRYWSRGVGMGEDYGFFYKCSLCEYEVEDGYTRCGFNFCPYCGADMRKGADDE